MMTGVRPTVCIGRRLFSVSKDVVFHQKERVGFIELARPQAMNALTIDMSKELNSIRRSLGKELDVDLVVLKGQGKAFCSGGDLKAIHGSLSAEDHIHQQSVPIQNGKAYIDTFRAAYTFCYSLTKVPQTQIAIWNGLVMGAGVGFSLYGPTFRVVTENTVFAMPECGIGLFPDIGASYWLSRLPEGYGRYLGKQNRKGFYSIFFYAFPLIRDDWTSIE
jgi:enoyl-CoA hydratase/carnithine racemase